MSNSINIYGNASNVQIQQNCQNSVQNNEYHTMNKMDIEKYQAMLDQINANRSQFDKEFGEKSDELKAALSQAQEALDSKDVSMWNKAMGIVRDLMIEAGGSLIASGILSLIPQI